jgi:hypothetical protein
VVVDLIGVATTVEAAQQSGLVVVSDQGGGLTRVNLEATTDCVLFIVVALNQAGAILVAYPLALGGVELDVVDVSTLGAHAPARQAPHDLLVRHVDEQRGRETAI